MDALEQFIVPNMDLKNPILDYLKHEDNYNFDIALNVSIKSKDMENYHSVSDSNFKVNYILDRKWLIILVHVLDSEATISSSYDQRM